MDTNDYEPRPESEEDWREGLSLSIRLQTSQMSAKLWKLLSSYGWKEPDMGDKRPYERRWGNETHKNKIRSRDASANSYFDRNSKTRQEPAISLESWHDDVRALVGTGKEIMGTWLALALLL